MSRPDSELSEAQWTDADKSPLPTHNSQSLLEVFDMPVETEILFSKHSTFNEAHVSRQPAVHSVVGLGASTVFKLLLSSFSSSKLSR